jgi:hypothetical protein
VDSVIKKTFELCANDDHILADLPMVFVYPFVVLPFSFLPGVPHNNSRK